MATLSLTWEYLLVINMDLYHITRASSELGLLCMPSSSHSYSPHRSAWPKIVLESTTGNHQLGMAAVPCLWYYESCNLKRGKRVYSSFVTVSSPGSAWSFLETCCMSLSLGWLPSKRHDSLPNPMGDVLHDNPQGKQRGSSFS